jgi:AraC-like DNA-binding protein
MEAKRHYEDPELSLSSLAERLNMPPHELSRVINTVFKKSFNDFINEYRVHDMISKMRDPVYDNITLWVYLALAAFTAQKRNRDAKSVRCQRRRYCHYAVKRFPETGLHCDYYFVSVGLMDYRPMAAGVCLPDRCRL